MKKLNDLFCGTKGEGAYLVQELEQRGENFTKENLIAITKDANDRIVWLERGKPDDPTTGKGGTGLLHIVQRHRKEFADAGIPEKEIPQYLMTAVKYGTVIGVQGRRGGRAIYEFRYCGQLRRIAISIGNNGFIVGANPTSIPKE